MTPCNDVNAFVVQMLADLRSADPARSYVLDREH